MGLQCFLTVVFTFASCLFPLGSRLAQETIPEQIPQTHGAAVLNVTHFSVFPPESVHPPFHSRVEAFCSAALGGSDLCIPKDVLPGSAEHRCENALQIFPTSSSPYMGVLSFLMLGSGGRMNNFQD